MPAILWIILIIFSLLRIYLSSLFPITADEAYYWLWSKHLALSYVDHPPMIAYINFLFTLGRENLFMLRLSAAIISTALSIIIYFLAKKLFDEKTAFWSAALFQIIPHFFFVWLTMFVDIPLILFWSLSLFILSLILKDNKSYAWYLLVIPLGLGYLSKYTMFLFWPCLILCCISIKEYRFWLKRIEPYVSFMLSLIFFIPVIYWNSQNNWISFVFHANRGATDALGLNFLPFIGEQLIQFSPFFIFLLIPVFINARKEKRFLFYFSAPVLLLFLIFSIKVKIYPHWPSVGYIAAIPLTVNCALQKGERFIKAFLCCTLAFSLLVFSILFFISPGILYHQNNYTKNYKIGILIPENYKVFTQNHASAGQLEFYLKRPVYLAPKFLREDPV